MILKLKLALSTSVALSVTAAAASSFAVTPALFATGASFTAPTVTEAVAIFESTPPSFTLKVKLSGPL